MKLQTKRKNTIIWLGIAAIVAVLILGAGINSYLRTSYPIKYGEYVDASAQKYNLDKTIIYSVIKTESGFDKNARSHVGAIGLMQIMPETFEWLKNYKTGKYSPINADISRLEEPEINIDYGCCYLKFLIDRYNNIDTAIAAYNAGSGRVDKWLENSEYSNDGYSLSNIPYPETDRYVEKVANARTIYNHLYFGGKNNEQ